MGDRGGKELNRRDRVSHYLMKVLDLEQAFKVYDLLDELPDYVLVTMDKAVWDEKEPTNYPTQPTPIIDKSQREIIAERRASRKKMLNGYYSLEP
jgi:hypothetical protein